MVVALCATPRSAAAESFSLEDVLGFAPGSRPAGGEQIRLAFQRMADASPRVRYEEHGTSHEGRPLFHAIVTSERRMERLEEVREALGRRATMPAATPAAERPQRGRNSGAAGEGAASSNLPAVLWIGAATHGDEASGADAALIVLHHLAFDDSENTRWNLDRLLIVIDPVQNPDGRARFLADLTQWTGRIPNLDHQSVQHRSGWPTARGNHYFLDLNRDWFALSQPESRARAKVLLRWHPQVTLDLHEMGGFDSYLISPPREPFHPDLAASTHKWWDRFSRDHARAFGERGWSSYSRDWHEEFNPNRGASWPLFTGAVSFLAEQAGVDGSALRRPDGKVLAYPETVDHHVVTARSMIESVSAARDELLADYAAARSERLREGTRAFIIDDSRRPHVARRLAEALALQGIEVRRAEEAFRSPRARNYWGERRGAEPFPTGSIVIPLDQPHGRLARAILAFDPPLGSSFLTAERGELEAGRRSLLYETTAWSPALAYGVDVYETPDAVGDLGELLRAADSVSRSEPGDALRSGPGDALRSGPGDSMQSEPGDRAIDAHPRDPARPDRSAYIVDPDAPYGFLLDAFAEGAPEALAALHTRGITLRLATEPFAASGREFAVGTILARRAENGNDLLSVLEATARATGARFHGLRHARADSGPDLGGRGFRLLQAPRVAILSGRPLFQTTFGAIWHFLDIELGMPASIVQLASLSSVDLGLYNVIVIPDADSGTGQRILEAIGPGGLQALELWVNRGGTLITMGESCWVLFGHERPIGSLRERRQILDRSEAYRQEALRESGRRAMAIDEWQLRADMGDSLSLPPATLLSPAAVPANMGVSLEQDAWLRRFEPQGAILRANVDTRHWLAAGMDPRLPVMVKTDIALMAPPAAETVARLADAGDLRVSGLLWPEARQRWALTGYAVRERVGSGQVIAFLGNPYYRAYFHGSARLLANAILLGPGAGTAARVGW